MQFSQLLGAEIESAKLEMGPDGNVRVLFDEDELNKINGELKSKLDSTYRDWVPIWNESVENLETYRCVPIPIPDGGKSVYPAPISRIPADQIMSSVYNAIMRSDPIFSIDAYLNAEYGVPASQPAPNIVATAPLTSEVCAHRFEQGYEFIARERIQLPQKLMRGLRGAVCGSPYWWKVVADPEQRTTMTPKVEGALVDLSDKYEETKLRGDMVKWYLVPFTNCMMPIDMVLEDSGIDKSPWFAERTAWTPDHVAKRHAIGELFLIKDDETAHAIVTSTIDARDEFKTRAAQSTEKKVPAAPLQECDTWLVWFYRDLFYKDPVDGKKKLKRLSLLGDFALTTGKLMTCWLNGYEHQCRPYELVDQMDEGDCTVGRMKYHQNMFTYTAQAEVQGLFAALTPLFWFDPNVTDVSEFFKSKRVVALGDHIPGVDKKEWGTSFAAEKHYSGIEMMKLILSMSQLDSRENEFTMGGRPPGRTPASTAAQVYQHAEETKTAFLGRLSNKLSRLLRLDMETRRQYQPLGEILPVWDKKAKEAIQIPFTFPVGDVLDNFRIALTAADDAMREEHDPQQIMMRKQALMQDGEYVAKVIGAIMNLQAPLPPEGVDLFKKIIDRVQAMTREMMSLSVSDEESYDLTPEVESLVEARNRALAQLQAQPPQGAVNAQGPNQSSGPGAPGPAGQGSPQQGQPPAPSVPPVPPPAPTGPVSGAGAGAQ